MINSQERERKKISRELHDELGQLLTAITLNLRGIEDSLQLDVNDEIMERLSESKQITEKISDKIHDIIYDLRPSILDDMGLIPTLEWYAEKFEKRTGSDVYLQTDNVEQLLYPEIEIIIYRIIQEALTNTAKHADADKVWIAIKKQKSKLKIKIKDDGKGFDVDRLNRVKVGEMGMGLIGIRQRLSSINGTLDIKSKKEKGTSLIIRIPIGE